MWHWETLDTARGLRHRALAHMDDLEVAAVPLNYELWFFYELGELPDLNRALDQAVASGQAKDMHFAKELHGRFFGNGTSKAIDDVGYRLEAELKQLAQVLESTGEGSTSYGRTLGRAAEQLARSDVPPQLKSLIDTVAVATLQMSERNKALEAQVDASSKEVEALRSKMETIRQESLTDGLTGLANRRSFDESLASAIGAAQADGSSLCLLMCDIDHFKKFNDTWGHATGDQVLRLVSNCLSANVKGRDIAARYGGEELVVILPGTSLDSARTVAEQIRKTVESRKIVKKSTGESLGTVTLSIGAAAYRNGETPVEFVARADACLYEAKRSGRNRVHADRAA